MIIVNGLTKTLVVFGDVSQNDLQQFMALMTHAIHMHQNGESV